MILSLTTAASCLAGTDIKNENEFQIMLAGGALHTCSSLSLQNCSSTLEAKNLRSEILYQFTQAQLNSLKETIKKSWVKEGGDALLNIVLLLEKKLGNDELPKDVLSKNALFDALDELDLYEKLNALPDAAYFAFLDHMELVQLDSNGKRLKELASVPLTKNTSSKEIYHRFVAQAYRKAMQQEQKPVILFSTASSRDPFEVVDFYQSVFESLDIEAVWFPVDQSMAYALAKKTEVPNICERLDEVRARFDLYDRARVYPTLIKTQKHYCEQPEKLLELVRSSHGLFFNGGDQSKTLASLILDGTDFSDFWKAVSDRVRLNKMIVGGTSAGAAVHAGRVYEQRPIPMISSGTSEQAIKRGVFPAFAPSQRCAMESCENALQPDDVTYLPTGGSGLFDLGTVDTHFSERDREARLIALSLFTKTRLSVGVDETTALLYSREDDSVNLEVIGENGVFIVDGGNQALLIQNDVRKEHRQMAGFAHYLFSGMAAQLTLSVDDNRNTPSTFTLLTHEKQHQTYSMIDKGSKTLKAKEEGIWRNIIQANCYFKEPIRFSLFDANVVLGTDINTRFYVDEKRKHCGYTHLPFVIDYSY